MHRVSQRAVQLADVRYCETEARQLHSGSRSTGPDGIDRPSGCLVVPCAAAKTDRC
jgi:hypothetical protein